MLDHEHLTNRYAELVKQNGDCENRLVVLRAQMALLQSLIQEDDSKTNQPTPPRSPSAVAPYYGTREFLKLQGVARPADKTRMLAQRALRLSENQHVPIKRPDGVPPGQGHALFRGDVLRSAWDSMK